VTTLYASTIRKLKWRKIRRTPKAPPKAAATSTGIPVTAVVASAAKASAVTVAVAKAAGMVVVEAVAAVARRIAATSCSTAW
jgi:hypothetical protein